MLLTLDSVSDLTMTRVAIRSWLAVVLPAERVDEVMLASGEALANAAEHGQQPITVDLGWSGPLSLDMLIRDSGSWRSARPANRGRGLSIMAALMDTVTLDTTAGTAVKLSRRFD